MASSATADDESAITGINVTPFVDIALVLLIIFMVTAKYIAAPQAIPVDLPHGGPTNVVSPTIAVRVDASGAFSADARPVTDDQLVAYVRERRRDNAEVRAVIAADDHVPHGRVVRVIDLVRRGGVAKFALQTAVAESAP